MHIMKNDATFICMVAIQLKFHIHLVADGNSESLKENLRKSVGRKALNTFHSAVRTISLFSNLLNLILAINFYIAEM
jgi:hypothetical protein